MTMKTLSLRLVPRSAFGTVPRGDTLFGQLCWSVRRRHGNSRLTELLERYTQGEPFAVVGDAMPAGFVPRPVVPLAWLGNVRPEDRKDVKKRTWVPIEAVCDPSRWLTEARALEITKERAQPHNSISRLTGTTGRGAFAPYQMPQIWFTAEKPLDCLIVYDPAQIEAPEIVGLFGDMGASGFGRDATLGLGRFDVISVNGDVALPQVADATSYLTLAPCAPQGGEWDSTRCFYQPFTRFGRHGAEAALETGNPFKTPVLMANTGAVLTPVKFSHRLFVGCGIGGDGTLSKVIPETVHQGYAPVICIRLPNARETA